MAKQGSQEGQNERTPDQKAMDRARDGDVEQPSPDKGTEEGLPIDMRLQAGPDTASTEESEEDLASLLASFQEPEGDAKPEHAETEEDRELSRMISLMTSRAPGPVRPEETGEETSGGDETLEALPEGTEVIFDPSPEASVSEEDALAKMGAEASDTAEQDLAAALSEIEGAGLTETEAEEGDLTEVTGEDAEETEIASVAGDAILEEEAAGEEGDASEQASISTVEDELVESEAIEGYDVTDTVDALLSTIGLEEHEGASFAPPVPEGGIQDDGTPAEELVDDRILEDFRELHKGLHAPPVPAADGISALAGLSGGLAEGQARILCIDDDPDNRSLFKGILDAKDYTFIDAESGEEALEILREGEGDLVLLNLDIASQDGFELIEEAASDGTLSQIPILVNSASAEHIEKALRLGASDYFIHPMNVIDVKFQIPIKVKNLLKIRRAERMLSLVGGHPYADTMAVSPMEEGAEMETRDLPASGDETLSDLLEAGEEETLTASGETAGVSALEDLLKGDGEEDGEAEEDLTEKGEPLLGEEQEEEEGIVSEVAETEEDLVAALAESHEDLFDEEEKDEEESEEDLTAALATEEENLDKLFDEEDPSDPPAGTDQTPDALKEIVGLGAAGAAVAAVGVATMRSEPESDEDSRSAADILAQPPRKGASPIWHSPDVNHSHRERILQQRRAEFPRMSGRRRLLYATFALLLVGLGVWALWAKQRLRETGEVASVIPTPPKFQILEKASAPEETPAESSPAVSESKAEPKSESKAEASAASPSGRESGPEPKAEPKDASAASPSGRESGDYEKARERVSIPSREAGGRASEKAHLRATVEQVAAAGGQWWAPWRVIRESGESIKELVNERRRDDILEVFGVSQEKVERGLKRKSVVDFLKRKGFKVQGKQASDLSAREMFEILSMREIKTKDKIVAVLAALKDKATAARAERAARLKATQPSRLALRPELLKVDFPARALAVWERPIDDPQSAFSLNKANGEPGFVARDS